MLTTLRRIVQEVNLAKDLDETLKIVVTRVKKAIGTETCTVYLLDDRSNQYVLMATDGLNPKAVKKAHFKADEGLVGFIGQRQEPINTEDAKSHPHFLVVSLVGEDQYAAYLGVPIIHQRQTLGVIVVQQQEKRRFDETEEAFLITLSAQLAGVIAHAVATGFGLQWQGKAKNHTGETTFQGVPCVSGIAIGEAVVIYSKADLNAVPDRVIENIEAEIELFETALSRTRQEVKELRERLEKTLPAAEQGLFDVYLSILDKASLGEEVIAEIRKGNWVQGALRRVIEHHISHYADIQDEYLKERITDIKDIGRRVLAHLQEQSQQLRDYPEQTILVGEEITAADLAELPEGCLAGIISEKGSVNSHVTILSRAMNVPAIFDVPAQMLALLDGKKLIVDGYSGHVYVSPSSDLLQEFLEVIEQECELDANLALLRDLPAETTDGHAIDLFVNTGLLSDASLIFSVGAAGIGLFRTEVSFMKRENFPAEEEQRALYRQLLHAFYPRPVVMRTLDIGGDKILPYFPIIEANPYLGWRGIRVTLDHPEVFLVQLRAMLRANAGLGNLRIMFPMVTTLSELDDAIKLLNRAINELQEEGVDVIKPAVGVMIEVPSTVFLADVFSERVDFLSIGSNDLIQYILAVDRNNSRTADMYDALNPAVLKAIEQVLSIANQKSVPISICGEMASNPLSVILLLGMGFKALSMNASSLLRVKWVIRNFSFDQARRLLQEVKQMQNSVAVRKHLENAIETAGLGTLLHPGKRVKEVEHVV